MDVLFLFKFWILFAGFCGADVDDGVWSNKMGGVPTIPHYQFSWLHIGSQNVWWQMKWFPWVEIWGKARRDKTKQKIFRLRKPPAKLKRTAASAWKMFKPQIAKLGPICVRFEKQGQLNYNTLLSVSPPPQICGLIFQQQCKPQLIHQPCQCQDRRGSKFIWWMRQTWVPPGVCLINTL